MRKLVDKLRAQPELLSEVSSSWAIHSATMAIVDQVGQVSELQTGTLPFDWHHASPQKLLRFFVREMPHFASLLRRKLRDCPSECGKPWRIILYCDEVTPGNPLRPDNRRIIHSWYYSIRELGQETLCHAEAWMPLGVLRSVVAKTVRGKMSAVLRVLLSRFFVGPDGMSTAGVVLPFPGEPTVFFAKLGNILGDEAALKSLWASNGAAGAVLPVQEHHHKRAGRARCNRIFAELGLLGCKQVRHVQRSGGVGKG